MNDDQRQEHKLTLYARRRTERMIRLAIWLTLILAVAGRLAGWW